MAGWLLIVSMMFVCAKVEVEIGIGIGIGIELEIGFGMGSARSFFLMGRYELGVCNVRDGLVDGGDIMWSLDSWSSRLLVF